MDETETRPLDIVLATSRLARLGGFHVPELDDVEREAAEGRFDVESVKAASNALRRACRVGTVTGGNWLLVGALKYACDADCVDGAEASLVWYATALPEPDKLAVFIRDGTSVRRALDIDALLAQGS